VSGPLRRVHRRSPLLEHHRDLLEQRLGLAEIGLTAGTGLLEHALEFAAGLGEQRLKGVRLAVDRRVGGGVDVLEFESGRRVDQLQVA